jgi:hypothetical protein
MRGEYVAGRPSPVERPSGQFELHSLDTVSRQNRNTLAKQIASHSELLFLTG